MIDKFVKVGLVQFASIFGDRKKNIKKAIEMAECAVEEGAKIICFPEAFASGYNIDFLKKEIFNLAEDIDGNTILSLRKIAKKENVYIIAPVILKGNSKNTFTNSAVVIDDYGEIAGVYSKNHLWHLGEDDLFQKGDGYPIFKTRYCDIGIMVCYDMNITEPARILTLKGAEIIFMCSAWRLKDKYIYDILIQARAMENEVFLVAVNMFDMDKGSSLFGNSKIANPEGHIVIESLKQSEDILIYEIDLNEVNRVRHNAPYLKGRRPEQYSIICSKIDNN